MVTNQPTEQPEEQRWQQPQFSPKADSAPVLSGQVLVPGERVPPPSTVETVVSAVAGLVWPVMILLAIATPLQFWPAVIIAFIASSVLGAVKRQLRAQRRAALRPPSPPSQLR